MDTIPCLALVNTFFIIIGTSMYYVTSTTPWVPYKKITSTEFRRIIRRRNSRILLLVIHLTY